ncbi:MAG: helix-turn-helix transcriptional regulator [Bacteroidota bacterium]|nr:helix-turn-helix transcriptional regulator [Bacteroidota bacterium]
MKKDTSTLLIQNRMFYGYSQKDIAKWLGVSQSTYNRMESGKRKLIPTEAKALADLYGLSTKDFLAPS